MSLKYVVQRFQWKKKMRARENEVSELEWKLHHLVIKSHGKMAVFFGLPPTSFRQKAKRKKSLFDWTNRFDSLINITHSHLREEKKKNANSISQFNETKTTEFECVCIYVYVLDASHFCVEIIIMFEAWGAFYWRHSNCVPFGCECVWGWVWVWWVKCKRTAKIKLRQQQRQLQLHRWWWRRRWQQLILNRNETYRANKFQPYTLSSNVYVSECVCTVHGMKIFGFWGGFASTLRDIRPFQLTHSFNDWWTGQRQ